MCGAGRAAPMAVLGAQSAREVRSATSVGRAFASRKTKNFTSKLQNKEILGVRYCAILRDNTTRRSFRKFPLEQGSVALCGRSAERGRAARREAGRIRRDMAGYGGIWRDMAGYGGIRSDMERYIKIPQKNRPHQGSSTLEPYSPVSARSGGGGVGWRGAGCGCAAVAGDSVAAGQTGR